MDLALSDKRVRVLGWTLLPAWTLLWGLVVPGWWVAPWVKDLAVSLLFWCGLDPWLQNFCMLQAQLKNQNKRPDLEALPGGTLRWIITAHHSGPALLEQVSPPLPSFFFCQLPKCFLKTCLSSCTFSATFSYEKYTYPQEH